MAHHDLLIIGAGSGNSIIGPEHDHWDVAIAEPWSFGGTCMNRGCIPSKMLVHAADLALSARRAPALFCRACAEFRRTAGLPPHSWRPASHS